MPAQAISTEDLIKAHQGEKELSTQDLIKMHQDARPRQPFTPVESAAIGAIQGSTMGFADEIEAGARAGLKGLVTSINPQASGAVIEDYRNIRDQRRVENAQAKEDNPVSYTGGEIGGSLLGAGKIAKGASFLKSLITGAGVGAAAGLGTSNADVTKGDIGKAAEDTAGGAVVGAGFGTVAGAAKPVAKALSNSNVLPGVAVTLGEAMLHGNPSLTGLGLGIATNAAKKLINDRGFKIVANTGEKDFAALMNELHPSKLPTGEDAAAVSSFFDKMQPILESAKKGNPVAIGIFQAMSNINAPAVDRIIKRDSSNNTEK